MTEKTYVNSDIMSENIDSLMLLRQVLIRLRLTRQMTEMCQRKKNRL